MAGERPRLVQEEDRWPIASLQDCGGDSGQLQPSLGDRGADEEPLARVLGGSHFLCFLSLNLGFDCHFSSSVGVELGDRRYGEAAGVASAESPNFRDREKWVISPSGAQRRLCSCA
jgi:hypothetical protein